jgi:hypothetical protein
LGENQFMQFLYQTIKEIIDAGRVGTPVFVRFIIQTIPIDEHIIDILTRTIVMTGSWFTSIPTRIYVQHKENTAQVTASVEYTGGQTATISVNISNTFTSRVDLMLLGNKGALYHDGEVMPSGFDFGAEPLDIPEWLVDVIERSLFAGKPIFVGEVLDFE